MPCCSAMRRPLLSIALALAASLLLYSNVGAEAGLFDDASKNDSTTNPTTQPSPAEAANRSAIPAEAALKRADRALQGTYKEELAKPDAPSRRELAAKFLEAARATTDDLPAKFVLLREARDLAVAGGDPQSALAAVDETSRAFSVNQVAGRARVLIALSAQPLEPSAARTVLTELGALIEQAVRNDDYKNALALSAAQQDAAVATKMASLLEAVQQKQKLLVAQASRYKQMQVAMEKLKTSPDDAASNAAVGRYLCFVKGAWHEGLPMLAKAPDTSLKSAAEDDVANPLQPDDQVKLADAWWEIADHSPEIDMQPIRVHAGEWYRKAAPGLAEAEKTRVMARLVQLPAAAKDNRVKILKADYTAADQHYDARQVVADALDKDPFTPVCADNTLGADPQPYVYKTLLLDYQVGDAVTHEQIAEHSAVIVPAIPPEGMVLPNAAQEFTIVAARYGVGVRFADVTRKLRDLAKDPSTQVTIDNSLVDADPQAQMLKVFAVWFDYQGRRYARVVGENGTLKFFP